MDAEDGPRAPVPKRQRTSAASYPRAASEEEEAGEGDDAPDDDEPW